MESLNQSVIVFFSKDGNTRTSAMRLNKRLNGKIIELQEMKKGSAL
ncbi:hypothetical protein [Acetobacterium tundrae]|uniref:Flavodoxin-like domain-containing protein n=1 Tax=Acetobacterium tundrae TaxID=132932 RepID=A0ABR6WQG4_9FIRM|nr:hypothetical protein [Acetobacterium tundrae]MBC3798583.1 hypothetical protein [Acetobacterium tundrae]